MFETMDRSRHHESAAVLVDAPHEIAYGVILVGTRGEVQHSNRLARNELQSATTLSVSDGCLHAVHEAQRRPLQDALVAARQSRRSLVRLGLGENARMFAVMPLGAPLATSVETVLILCSRPEPFEALTLTLFAKSVGLTGAEQTVLASLCGGLTAQDIANLQSLCVSTVRSHIGHIREKTGASSIRQVVSMVAALPPMVRRTLN